MTHTPTPWYATGVHVQSAVKNEDLSGLGNYVCTAEGSSPEEAIANADLIVRAVNSHDALVSALKGCLIALRTKCPNVPEDERGQHLYLHRWTSDDEEAVEAGDKALALAQEVRE